MPVAVSDMKGNENKREMIRSLEVTAPIGNRTGQTVSQNFGIGPREFDNMLRRLRNGDESLFERVFLAQFHETTKFLQSRFKMSHEEAHEHTMEALLSFRRKMLLGKIRYGNLKSLFFRIATNTFYDSKKKEQRSQNAIDTFLASSIPNIEDKEELFEVLDTVLNDIDPSDRHLIEELFAREKDMKDLSVELGVTYSALRKRKERILKKISKIFFINLERRS